MKKVTLNPCKETVNRIRNFLKSNGGYCPCVPEQNEGTRCPCKKFRETKECCCGLYIIKEKGGDDEEGK